MSAAANPGSVPPVDPSKKGKKVKKVDDDMGLAKPPPPPKKLTKGEEIDKKIEEEEKKDEEEKKKEEETKPKGVNPHKSEGDDVPYDPELDFSSTEKLKLESPLFFEARNDNTDWVEHWPINPYPFVLA